MFKTLARHLALATLFFFLTLAQQYLFYYVKGIPIVWLTAGKYLGTFAFFVAATFIRPPALRYLFLSFVFLLNAFQMGHMSYFGTQVLPNEIYLLFAEFHEVQGTLLVEPEHVLLPLLFTLVPALVGYLALRRTTALYGTKVLGVLFCLYFVYNPIRTFVTGNTWGRQPSTRELAGMNVYLSFSYFLGKILPTKVLRTTTAAGPNSSGTLFLSDAGAPRWDHVIFILGESLTPNHMSLFGYERSTTPFLRTQLDNPNFLYRRGLSGGVSTDIAVAFFLNMGFGDVGSLKAAKGTHCLFKLAKAKRFTTHFLSAQSAEQLRYIAPYLCASSLDDYRSLEDISPGFANEQAVDDKVLLPELARLVAFEGPQFVMLHQRGSHAPWERRSRAANRKFPHDSKVNHYDNSVIEFDLFMRDLDQVLRRSKKKILVIYVSDHGEALGEEGKWGHGQLTQAAFEVPVLLMSYSRALPPLARELPQYVPHYNVSLLLVQELGYTPSATVATPPPDYVIFGNDIDGFAGRAKVSWKPGDGYDFKVVD
jgi:glucan phosphoethanolaminetransferase (alkaline phosphatase superfamily)